MVVNKITSSKFIQNRKNNGKNFHVTNVTFYVNPLRNQSSIAILEIHKTVKTFGFAVARLAIEVLKNLNSWLLLAQTRIFLSSEKY